MKIMKAIPINTAAHQNSWKKNDLIIIIIDIIILHSNLQLTVIHCATVRNVSLLNKRFFNLANGPSASTALHFKNTSQYP